MVYLLRTLLDIRISWATMFIYLTVTGPDIANAVPYFINHFASAPIYIHFGHLLRVLRYLGTSSRCLFYACYSLLQLHAYSNSTWASAPKDRCSVTGYCIHLGSSLAWKSKRQAFVPHSNTEAEPRALAATTIEIYGFDGCLLILAFHVMFPHLFYVIILDP